MFERGHGAGVDVEVGIDLDRRDAEAQRSEDHAGRARDHALAQTREHAARHQHVLDHDAPLLLLLALLRPERSFACCARVRCAIWD